MGKKKGILILCNLDTRGEDIKVVKKMIEDRGHRAVLMDFSMEEPPPFPGDITCEQVAEQGGLPIEKVRQYYRTNRAMAMENQIQGATAIAQDLLKKGRVDGIFGMGGMTGSLVATSVMKTFPFGMPKLMATPIASMPRYINRLVGTKDISMHHTVLDFVKMNPLLEIQVTNAVHSICGMVEGSKGKKPAFDKPVIAITNLGLAEMCVHKAVELLTESGFAPVVIHAQGVGDRAMEEMIREGLFDGVVDVWTGGIVENLFDGNRDPGPDRLLAASERGLPQIICPGGIDNLSYGSRPEKQELIKSRKHVIPDEARVWVRTSAKECQKAASVIAERLNKAKGPFKVLIPLRGWSSLDMEGRPCYDPEADAAFTKEIKERLNKKEAIEEVDLHLYTPEFAGKVVNEFVKIYHDYEETREA